MLGKPLVSYTPESVTITQSEESRYERKMLSKSVNYVSGMKCKPCPRNRPFLFWRARQDYSSHPWDSPFGFVAAQLHVQNSKIGAGYIFPKMYLI